MQYKHGKQKNNDIPDDIWWKIITYIKKNYIECALF